MEIWREVPEYEGVYEVSNLGRVRRVETQRVLKGKTLRNGYREVTLSREGNPRFFLIHRLVMLAFKGAPPEKHEVCHNDGNKENNRLDNLRYDTHSNNAKDRIKHGTCRNSRKTLCPRGHNLNFESNRSRHYSAKGFRQCRACHRAESMVQRYPWLGDAVLEISNLYYENPERKFFQSDFLFLLEGSPSKS